MAMNANIDLKALSESVASQFKGLNGRPPGQWPLLPRLFCGVGVVVGVVVVGYSLYWKGQFEERESLAAKEQTLRSDYTSKMAQAINLEALKAQKVQVDRYVDRLEKQLPGKAEMAALVSDINVAGRGRGLQIDLFKPNQVVLRDYYAELPIDIKVNGSYHDIGAFAGDLANLSRIVTLNNMKVVAKDGKLEMEAQVKTFRYLDPEEAAEARKQRMERDKAAKSKKGAGK
jgi:type IV pilus assembly protein PilO